MADIEEFEFKPLTEGLGFHKKADKIKADMKSTNLGATATREQAPRAKASSLMSEPPMGASAASLAMPTTAPAMPSTFSGSLSSKMAQPPARETKTAQQSISELMAALPPSLDFIEDKPDLATRSSLSMAPAQERPQIYQPLAREDYKSSSPMSGAMSGPSISSGSGPTLSSVLPAPGTKAGSTMGMGPLASATMPAPMVTPSPYRERMNEGFAKAFPKTEAGTEAGAAANRATAKEAAEGLQPVAANFASGLIDGMVITGIATILLVCIVTITKINIIGLLTNAGTDTKTQFNLVLLFAAVLQVYMLVSRAFAGATLGEWAFDLQLGTNDQQKKLTYPLQVLWRTAATTLTGLFALPLLSFAFNRDLGKYITGIQLYRRL